MMTLEEYNHMIENLATNKVDEIVWNDSRAHNAIIMKEMFKSSQEIMMFCGKGSIFGNSFAKIVEEEAKEYSNLMTDLYGQIKSFLQKGKLTIILENSLGLTDVTDDIYNTLIDKQKEGALFIYKLDDELNPEYHFSIGDDNKYRREIGAEEHNAFANFNDKDKVCKLEKQFQILLHSSCKIDIIKKELEN